MGSKSSGSGQVSFDAVSVCVVSEVNVLIMQRNVMASGVIPQISLIMGPCAGKYTVHSLLSGG